MPLHWIDDSMVPGFSFKEAAVPDEALERTLLWIFFSPGGASRCYLDPAVPHSSEMRRWGPGWSVRSTQGSCSVVIFEATGRQSRAPAPPPGQGHFNLHYSPCRFFIDRGLYSEWRAPPPSLEGPG